MKTGVWGGNLSHLLIDGDGITIGGSKFSPGQPDLLAIVMMTQTSRMMEATDRGDDRTVLLKRLE